MKRLQYKKDYWDVPSGRTTVRPFPGKTPTRWNIVVGSKDGVAFRYKGKPSLNLIPKILNLAKRVKGVIWMYEFDKGGPFRASVRTLPVNNLQVTSICTPVATFYYPFTAAGGNFFLPVMYPKYGILKDKAFFFFSPNKVDNDPTRHEALRHIRRWIGESKVAQNLPRRDRLAARSDIEVIRFSDLPKVSVPAMRSVQCPNCGRVYSKRASFRGLAVHCPTCNYATILP